MSEVCRDRRGIGRRPHPPLASLYHAAPRVAAARPRGARTVKLARDRSRCGASRRGRGALYLTGTASSAPTARCESAVIRYYREATETAAGPSQPVWCNRPVVRPVTSERRWFLTRGVG